MIYYMDLPSEIYSICVVWWWNLWLSAFLQWKRAVKHSGSMKKKQKKKHTALSFLHLCNWAEETTFTRVWFKHHITDSPLGRHADLAFIIHHSLTYNKLYSAQQSRLTTCLAVSYFLVTGHFFLKSKRLWLKIISNLSKLWSMQRSHYAA